LNRRPLTAAAQLLYSNAVKNSLYITLYNEIGTQRWFMKEAGIVCAGIIPSTAVADLGAMGAMAAGCVEGYLVVG